MALRTLCIILHLERKKEINGNVIYFKIIYFKVEFVHGDLKYTIAPLYSENARNDPFRDEYISGHSNTGKRKILGKNDAFHILKENKERNMIEFLEMFSRHIDQLYDITDAILIARTKYEKDLKSLKKK